MPPVHRLGLISDLHVLSQYGLVPPSHWPQGSLAVQPSAQFYRHVWSCWEDFCKRCPKLDALIINGDLIEGENPSKKDAMDALTDNILAQCRASEEVLAMIRPKADKLVIVRGTPYHDSKHFEGIESVARNMGAEQWTPGRYTGYVYEGSWRGFGLNITHHMTTGAIYRGTIADRTALFAVAAERLGHVAEADIIVRSHLHMKFVGKTHGKWVILTPAWKLVTPYAIKKMEFYRANLLSDLGAIILETDGSGRLLVDDTTFAYQPIKSRVHRVLA